MKGPGKSIWFFIILFACAILLLFVFTDSSKKKFDWNEYYSLESQEPYALNYFKKLLNKRYDSDSVAVSFKKYAELPSNENVSLIIVGPAWQPGAFEAIDLATWIEQGHDVLIIQKTIPAEFSDLVWDTLNCINHKSLNAGYYYKKSVKASHFHSSLSSQAPVDFDFRIADSLQIYDFGCFDSSFFCQSSPLIPLAALDEEYINFAGLQYGKGRIYFHVSPVMFSNYALSNYKRFQYAENILSYLSGNKIIVDQGHIYPPYESQAPQAPQSPFQFILSQEALRIAFYLLLSLAVIYILMNSRRNQRVIPVLEPPVNSSLEFLQATGRIYFLNRDHAGLLSLQARFLLQFIGNRYNMRVKKITELNMQELSARSGVPITFLNDFINEYKRLHLYVQLTDKDIVGFYKLLNHFYKTCN
jgi:hypothetical protein